jgi:hypothetical protein
MKVSTANVHIVLQMKSTANENKYPVLQVTVLPMKASPVN